MDGITDKEAAAEFGVFPELTAIENNLIHHACRQGFATFSAAFPNAETQARSTLANAQQWLLTVKPVAPLKQPKD